MMKTTYPQTATFVLLAVFMFFTAGACGGKPAAQEPEQKPRQIRVFENGSASIKLFPDETFIANLFHNTKITGTYTEKTEGGETAVLFAYNGINAIEDGVNTFTAAGTVTAVGGILNGALTIPEDWEDGHGHGDNFIYREYPLVFAGSQGQKIILNADNTFVANFSNEVTIIGFYGIRSSSVTFVPGSPTFNGSGVLSGTVLLARLLVEDDGHDDHDDHVDEHDEHDDHDGDDKSVVLEIPDLWVKISGGSEFVLQ